MTAYVAEADVAAALNLPEDARLTAPTTIGATAAAYGPPPGPNPGQPAKLADLPPGALVAVGYRGTISETAVVQSVAVISATAGTGTITFAAPLTLAHAQAARIIDVTQLTQRVQAASYLIDDATRGRPDWLAYGAATETRTVRATRERLLEVPVVKRLVDQTHAAITAVSYTPLLVPSAWASTPPVPAAPVTVPVSACTFDDDSYHVTVNPWAAGVCPPSPFERVMVTISYVGGYATPTTPANPTPPAAPMPPDLVAANLAVAARLWKEKDSGFSDTLGSAADGTLTYKKAVPADVQLMLRPWTRAGWPT